jgi:hypothetical protein
MTQNHRVNFSAGQANCSGPSPPPRGRKPDEVAACSAAQGMRLAPGVCGDRATNDGAPERSGLFNINSKKVRINTNKFSCIADIQK